MFSKISTNTKIILVLLCFGIAIYGFMIKLPSSFRRYDKELHSLFYFLAAAFLNLFFGGKKLLAHLIIFVFLYLFGMAIEYSQEASNKFLGSRIHGRYDPEDMAANLKGLVVFSLVWLVFVAGNYLIAKPGNKSEQR